MLDLIIRMMKTGSFYPKEKKIIIIRTRATKEEEEYGLWEGLLESAG